MTRELLDLFFPGSWGSTNEVGSLVNSPWGDTCDVLLQDAPLDVLAAYPVLITSGNIAFTQAELASLQAYVAAGGILLANRAHARQFPVALGGDLAGACLATKRLGAGTVIVYGPDFNLSQAGKIVIDALARAILPVKVDGDVQFLVNRLPSSWVVTLVNNNGVIKAPRLPPVVDPAGARTVTVTLGGDLVPVVTSWISDLVVPAAATGGGHAVSLALAPGAIEILEFST